MKSTSTIEISKAAIEHNLSFIRNVLPKKVKISSVIKGNAYGHGIEQYVPNAECCGINHFSVFSSDEAERVFKIKKPDTTVMIMGWINKADMSWVIENEIEFFVFEFERLIYAINTAKRINKAAIIHIEVETGMNRTGFVLQDMQKLISLLKNNRKHVVIKGMCTHYAGAESIANHVRVKRQIIKFNEIYNWLGDNDIKPEIRHTACSAAAISYPKTRMDMVRIGILQYGYWPSSETLIYFLHKNKSKYDPLRRVIRWKSSVMTVKSVKEGKFISYGTAFFTTENKKIAIIPVGYVHGYSRSLSNQGRVLIHGQRVPVIGMVNMNMLIADVTLFKNVKYGDEVIIIGRQKDSEISVSAFTEFSNQLNYELLTRIPESTERIITK